MLLAASTALLARRSHRVPLWMVEVELVAQIPFGIPRMESPEVSRS
jgi:hypothetical protein